MGISRSWRFLDVSEENVFRYFSFTGHDVYPNDLHTGHQLKNKKIQRELKLKHSMQIKSKVLQQKSLGLSQLNF